MKITKKDIQILSHLRRDSREMLTKLSRKTGIPVSTIFDRLKYHKNGLIKKNTTLMDFSLLGFNSRAKVILKVDKTDRISIKNLLTVHRNINAAYRINNGYDFMFEAIFRNMKDLEDFINSLEEQFNILEKHVYYVIDDIKEEDFLSRDDAHEIAFTKKQL
ncbi:Lrp/AsnC family transcriptional regulator [Candidatus Woesearchaeota archaeon]|jgi:DNA-binding Lrp family transcriptional regulator|nr:Lrp/AsnC family transcriptional regulator [Candidatus Woesearchaeota archaeon]MBT6044863.1 Lrp/AsnC family transcriptional regulator [Candidatus Woesearchaeota archaeon]